MHPGEEVGNGADELLDEVEEVTEQTLEDVTKSGDGTVSEERDDNNSNLLHDLGETLGKGVDDERTESLGNVADNRESLEVLDQSGEQTVDLGETLLEVVVDSTLGLVGVRDDVKSGGDSLEDNTAKVNEVVDGGVSSNMEKGVLVDGGGGKSRGGKSQGDEDVLDGNHGEKVKGEKRSVSEGREGKS